MRISGLVGLALFLSLVAMPLGAARVAGAELETIRYAFVSIQCRSPGALPSQGCTYYSDVLPVADLGGGGTTLTNAEKRILQQRVVARFDTLGKPCSSKLVNVSLAYPSRAEAEAQRARFMANSRTACRESFPAGP